MPVTMWPSARPPPPPPAPPPRRRQHGDLQHREQLLLLDVERPQLHQVLLGDGARVLRHEADALHLSDVDGRGRETERDPLARQGDLLGTGCGVVRLAGVSDERGRGREQDEEVERLSQCRPVEGPGAQGPCTLGRTALVKAS